MCVLRIVKKGKLVTKKSKKENILNNLVLLLGDILTYPCR